MTAPWSEARDIADQRDESNEAWRDEVASQRNADADAFDPEEDARLAERHAEWWGETAKPDPWGDVGPVHHPTRFDLPVSAEPPF